MSAALDELAAAGHLSEQRFAEAYARERAAKGFGPRRILAELGERGVDRSLAQSCLDALAGEPGGPSWEEQAGLARRKKFGDRPPGEGEARLRQMRYLEYRGFTHEQIRDALRACGSPDCDTGR